MAKCDAGRRRFKARGPIRLQGCNARARGSLRRHLRGDPVERARRKARATAGTHSGRGRPPARPMCRGDSKRLGARGSAWPCVSEVAAAVRGRFQLKNWSRACACQGISWNCVNGFATVRKRLVQANACSGRPRRDPYPGCGAVWPLIPLPQCSELDKHLPCSTCITVLVGRSYLLLELASESQSIS